MDVEAVFKRYDIRGSYPDEIDKEFAQQLGEAIGQFVNDQGGSSIIVSQDTRDASASIMEPLKHGLVKALDQVIHIGIGPTDRLARAATRHRSHGIQVTASHNAWTMTGIKCVYPTGNGYSNDDMDEIKRQFHSKAGGIDGQSDGVVIDIEASFDEDYIDDATAYLEDRVNEEPAVLLDCCNGAAYRIGPWLYEELGFNVTAVNTNSSPDHTVPPEPMPATRETIPELVETNGCDCAVLTDPDGDRLIVYDDEMGWLDGDQVFYAIAELVEAETIAASIDTADILEETGAQVTYSRVGDVFVSALGREIDADLLGEPNGHYALPAFSWYNSGLVAGALVAGNLQQVRDIISSKQPIQTERTTIPFAGDEDKEAAMQEIIKHAAKQHSVVSTVDGIKYTTETATVLVRPSGTSPKIRIVVNADDPAAVQPAIDEVHGWLE